MAGKKLLTLLNEEHTKNDPLSGIHYEPFDERIVKAVDLIVDVAKKNGSQSHVQTSYDWRTIEFIYHVWTRLYPADYEDFVNSIKWFRQNEHDHGIGGDKGARIQHQLEVPKPLYSMIMTIFPDQEWDRKFVHKLAKEIPALKVINDSF